jgi:hypothetical protein
MVKNPTSVAVLASAAAASILTRQNTLVSVRQLLRALTIANDVRECARSAAIACDWPTTSLSFSS